MLFLPEFKHNLLSVSKLIQNNIEVVFDDGGCIFQDLISREKIAYGRKADGVYLLNLVLEE